MTDKPDALRDRIAEALMSWADLNANPQYATLRRPETVRQNAYGRADAVLAVLDAAGIRDAARTATARQTGQQPDEERTPCSGPVACEDGGEPCDRHEREQAHAEGEHELCGAECPAAGLDASQPATDQLTVVSLARMLSAADVEINHGNYPTYDTLAESGQQQYRQAARYLLARCSITARAVEGTDQ